MKAFRTAALAAYSARFVGFRPVVQSQLLVQPQQTRCCSNIFRRTSSNMKSPSHFSGDLCMRKFHTATQPAARVTVPIDGKDEKFSAILLRDLCKCPACVHADSKQKLYSTTDIPVNIRAKFVNISQSVDEVVDIHWEHDVPGFGSQHSTRLNIDVLRAISETGVPPSPSQVALLKQTLWDASSDRLPDFRYDAYMEDDTTLLRVIEQLRTHGLVFITNVPGIEKSVSAIAERIGPVKDTFYGYTWDVRTVPKPSNAAYTSGELGFHTDLLYFQNPPHVQLLHCIESSSTGGASVFADAFKAALDLYSTDMDAFDILATLPANYHYEHPDSNMYKTTKPVIDMRPLRIGNTTYATLSDFLRSWESQRQRVKQHTGMEIPPLDVGDCLEKINWGPPFLAPFSLDLNSMEQASGSSTSAREYLNHKVDAWHAAATKFSMLLQRPEGLHERLMKPGECVLFDNTRVLHSRRAFNSNDAGKARWLRGTYVDKDPYLSKLRVLRHRFEFMPRVGREASETGDAIAAACV